MLAQISDLEYRITKHNELHYQIRRNKGAVLLENVVQTSATSNTTSTDISTSTSPSTSSLTVTHPPSQQSVNGYRGILPGNTKALEDLQPPPNGAHNQLQQQQSNIDCMTASRTRPFQRSSFRKRKLVQTANLHTISKKAAKSRYVVSWYLYIFLLNNFINFVTRKYLF